MRRHDGCWVLLLDEEARHQAQRRLFLQRRGRCFSSGDHSPVKLAARINQTALVFRISESGSLAGGDRGDSQQAVPSCSATNTQPTAWIKFSNAPPPLHQRQIPASEAVPPGQGGLPHSQSSVWL